MSRQNILVIVLILSFLAGGYVWYLYLYPSQDIENVQAEEQIVSPDFLAKTEILTRIQIDSEFFKNAVFTALDAGLSLPPIPTEINGRANPFAQF